MYKLFMFDFDGTVADTLDTISYYCNKTLADFSLPPIEKERFKYLVGKGASILVENILKENNAYTDELHKKMLPHYTKMYDNDCLYLTRAYDKIPETLKALKEKGYKLAIISNKPNLALELSTEALFGKDLFDMYLGQREGVPIKPHPQGPQEILDTLGVKQEECVYVGDTAVDMQTGKNINAYTVGVLWGFRTYDELNSNGADIIISSPEELLNI